MRTYWRPIFKFFKIYSIFHLIFWLFLLMIGRDNQSYSDLLVIWFGVTLLLPLIYGWVLVLFRGDKFEGAFRIIFHINLGVPYYTLFLLIVFLGCFVILFFGGWNLYQYLYQNGIISNELVFLIMVGTFIFAFLFSYYLLLKVSDYLYLHGY